MDQFYSLSVYLIFWFLTTGDAENRIHFEGYQVSNQCMALVSDDCLIPTRDAPELGYVKESTNEQYVPDVFYKVNSCLFFPQMGKFCSSAVLSNLQL